MTTDFKTGAALLVETPQPDDSGASLVVSAEQNSLPSPLEADVEEDAGKAHFTLGDDSPGMDELRVMFFNREDDAINRMAAEQRKKQLAQTQEQLVQDALTNRPDPSAPLSLEEAATIDSLMVSPKVNVSTALDDQFSEKYYDESLTQAMEAVPEIREAVDENPEKAGQARDIIVQDIDLINLAKREMKRLSEADFGAAKVTSDVLEKFFVPGKEAYEIFVLDEDLKEKGIELPDESILPGKNKKEKYQYIYSLPKEAQEAILPAIVDSIAERNVLSAQIFLSELMNYSASDERFNNIITALDLVDITSTTGAAAAGFKLFAFAKVSQAIARGSIRKPRGVTRALDSIGETTKSAFIQAKQRIQRKANNTPELENVEEVLDQVPTLFNPDSLFIGGETGLSTLQQERLLTLFRKHGEKLMGGIDQTLVIKRLRSGDVDDILRAANEFVPLEFPTLQGKITGARVKVPSEKTLTNNDIIEVSIGDINGDLFTSKTAATKMAKDIYGIKKFGIRRQGGRYSITIDRAIDERTPFIRSLPLGPDEQVPSHSTLVDGLRGAMTPENTFSRAGSQDRATAVLGASRLVGIARTADDMFRALPGKSRARLSKYLNAERAQVDEFGVRGKFATNVAELQEGWRKAFDRSPTDNEIAGYFVYRQLSDMDWVIRNFTTLGGKLRRNIKNTTIKRPNGGQLQFEGAPSSPDALTGEPATILITKANGQNELIRIRTPEDRAKIDKLVNKDGFMMTHVTPEGDAVLSTDRNLKKTIGTAGVDFVLSRGARYSPLAAKQIEYEPGAHRIYHDGSFTAQPKLHREFDGDGNPIEISYKGDNALMWFKTDAEARHFTPLIDRGRQILKRHRGEDGQLSARGEAELARFLETQLPVWSPTKFKNMFREFKEGAAFTVRDEFLTTQWGRSTNDVHKLGDRMSLPAGMFRDQTKSSYDLYSEMRQTFLGEQSQPLLTLRGGPDNTTLRKDFAPTVDAFPALERGINSLVHSKFLDDMKINAANRFVEEFGDLMTPPKDVMRRNPIPHLLNPQFKGADRNKEAIARVYARQTKELLNVDNPTVRRLHTMRQNMMDKIFQNAGQKGVQAVPDWALGSIRHPADFMREAAFHLTLGFFNVVQLFVQGTTFASIAALGGVRNTLRAAPAAWLMQFAKQTTNPEHLKSLANVSRSFGWKREHWLEMNDLMQKSGFGVLGRDQALLDDAFNTKFISSRLGNFLDAGTVFFTGIERALRNGALATAYREWRRANPKAKFGDAQQKQVLDRARIMNVDMVSSSNASWQKGWASIPTQFWSYPTRMMEQFIGKRLTRKERLRLMAMYGAVFGLPASIAIRTTVPFSDIMRDKLNSMNVEVNETVWEPFRDGLASVFLEAVAGTDFDVTGRLSPEGLGPGQLMYDLVFDDADTLETILGVGGGKLGDVLLSTAPPIYRWYQAVTNKDIENQPIITSQEAMGILGKISSFNVAEKMYFAVQYDALVMQSGRLADGTDPTEGLLSAVLGLTPDRVAELYSMRRVTQDFRQFKRKLREQMIKEAVSMYRAVDRNDTTLGHTATRAISLYSSVGQFTDKEMATMFEEAARQANVPLHTEVTEEFLNAVIGDKIPAATIIENLDVQRERELNRPN